MTADQRASAWRDEGRLRHIGSASGLVRLLKDLHAAPRATR
ncbi:hypothetical protein [Streptomyces roseirectus]|nr:hypothetical protein [Streptomyces roseirectus]